jgi:hypothetical protein
MAQGKQAKILSPKQEAVMLRHLETAFKRYSHTEEIGVVIR